MSKHTPGPWKFERNPRTACTFDVYEATGIRIAEVLAGPSKFNAMGFVDPNDAVDGPHNARLIAAAPELLEALRPFAALLQSHHANCEDSHPVFGINGKLITVGDLRAACAARGRIRESVF